MRAGTGTVIVLLLVTTLAGTGKACAYYDDDFEPTATPGLYWHESQSNAAVFVKGRGWTYRHGNFYVGSFPHMPVTNDRFSQTPQLQNKVKAATDAYEPIRVDRTKLLGRIHDIEGEVEKLTEQIKEVDDAVSRYSYKFSQVHKMGLDQIDNFLKGKTDTLNGYDAEVVW
jgi:hypothetical protein